jgi:chemotaxis protein MotB
VSRHSPSYHDEGNDHFFMSFTDLLVGIIFLFLLMLMAFAMRYEDATAHHQKTADEVLRIDLVRQDILRAIAERMQQRGYTIIVDYENGLIRLPEDLLFDSAQWTLSAKGTSAISALADVFAEVLPCTIEQFGNSLPACNNIPRTTLLESILIEGHTDKQPYSGKGMSNWELSAFRAITVYKALVADQPSLEASLNNRKGEPVLGVSAYAERRPVDVVNLTPNRRIDVRFNLRAPQMQDVVEVY